MAGDRVDNDEQMSELLNVLKKLSTQERAIIKELAMNFLKRDSAQAPEPPESPPASASKPSP